MCWHRIDHRARRAFPTALIDPEGYWTGFSARIRVIAYNTKMVTPNDAPQSIFDLADPKWKGQVAMADPRFGSTSFHVAALYALAGDEKMDDFFRRLKANGVRIVEGNSVVRDLVARGEVKTGLTDTDDVNVAIENGQPVGMVLPDREGLGVPVMPNMVSLVAGAPHPEEARKLIDYLLSAGRRATTRPIGSGADSASCRRARSEEHSGDRDIQTDDARLCESCESSRRCHEATRDDSGSVVSRAGLHQGDAQTDMWRWQSSRTAVVGAAIVVFVVCCVLPVGYLLTVSLSSVDAFPALLLDARQRRLLYNTALLGIGTAFLATAIGAPLGIALARIALPGKAMLRLALAAPVLLPPYIVGLAWTYLGSSRGWLGTSRATTCYRRGPTACRRPFLC